MPPATTDGKPISSDEARLRSVQHPADGRWAYTWEVDLSDIQPGSYVLTLEATSTGRAVRRLIPINVEE